MRKSIWLASLLMLVLGVGVRADVWDVGPENDNSSAGTQNELVHGSDQFHDLAAQGGTPDEEWYRIGQKPYSSYEVVVDSTSATLSPGLQLERVDTDGSTVVQSASPVTASLNFSQSLRWENASASNVDGQFVRLQSSSCTSTCTANDVYRIRAYETTYSIPRFNNTGTQATVLIIQNPTAYTISGSVYFWSGSGGVPLSTQTFSLSAKQLLVLQTSSIPALAGQAGAVTISNDGRYGALSGKAVALESATGYTFDTLMVPLPN